MPEVAIGFISISKVFTMYCDLEASPLAQIDAGSERLVCDIQIENITRITVGVISLSSFEDRFFSERLHSSNIYFSVKSSITLIFLVLLNCSTWMIMV